MEAGKLGAGRQACCAWDAEQETLSPNRGTGTGDTLLLTCSSSVRFWGPSRQRNKESGAEATKLSYCRPLGDLFGGSPNMNAFLVILD